MNTYTVTLNGVTISRKSRRTYTHAIVGWCTHEKRWKVLSFCGTVALAERAVKARRSSTWFLHQRAVPVGAVLELSDEDPTPIRKPILGGRLLPPGFRDGVPDHYGDV